MSTKAIYWDDASQCWMDGESNDFWLRQRDEDDTTENPGKWELQHRYKIAGLRHYEVFDTERAGLEALVNFVVLRTRENALDMWCERRKTLA